MTPPRALLDAPDLHPVTLAFRDRSKERVYLDALAARFSRRRYASTSLLSAVLWAGTGSWLRIQHPEYRDLVATTFIGLPLSLIAISVAFTFAIPRALVPRWMPPTAGLVCTGLGFAPAITATLGLPVLVGFCLYLMALHSFLGLRFIHALVMSSGLIVA